MRIVTSRDRYDSELVRIYSSFDSLKFIMIFNTPSACGGVIPLKSGPGLALGFNTLYSYQKIAG